MDEENDDNFLDRIIDEHSSIRRCRTFKPRINYCLIDSASRFRLKENHIKMLLQTIGPLIAHPSKRNYGLSSEQQCLLALRYLATGCNFKVIGDAHGVDKATVSRTLKRFVSAVNTHILPKVVKWPDNKDEVYNLVSLFREKGGMPAVFGCIDGTHVKLIAPSIDEPNYVNRHGDHSINCMLVCGPNLRIYYQSCKWPGSVNDSRVFRNSSLARKMENGWRPFPNGVLLGDSGYPNLEYLITPLTSPVTPQELKFNVLHKKTRHFIECTNGLIKQRFRCLLGMSTCCWEVYSNAPSDISRISIRS